ncbi:MAG: GLUG motif-containing protein [Dehalococcoidia bacterium]
MARISIFLIALALVAGMVGCPSPSQNLEIRTWYDLDAITNNLAGNHILMNDLDSTIAGYEELASPTANGGKGWQPIGFFGTMSALGCGLVGGAAPWWYGLTGTFDGQGYEIRDLFINRPDECGVRPMGLFGSINEGGIIKNVGVVNVTVIGCETVGGLAGWNYYGTVSNSYSSGSVTGNDHVGGLLGTNSYGTVSSSYSTGNVTGNNYVGGLLGENIYGTVSNSYYNYDEVLINGEKIITIGALFAEDFEEWLVNHKFLDVNERLSQENGYYVVNNFTDFKELLAFGQDGLLKFRLANDLDLGSNPGFYIPYLAGEFDGNGHKISHLSLNFNLALPLGLFGYLAPSGKVTQVGIENINITGAENVGGLVGYNRGTVSNSYSTGNVTGGSNVGGLMGWNYEGDVSNSYSSGTVTGYGDVGGLAGRNDGTVSNSYSTCSVTGTWGTGGLVGHNWKGTVSNSCSTGNVTGASWVGGLVGYNLDGAISNSYSTGSVTGTSGTGGVAGGNIGTVSNSYSTGSVTGEKSVGGLVGFNGNDGTVSNSYSTCSVSGNENVGGLVGSNIELGTVSNCYSTGSVTGDEHVGGLVGRNDATVRKSFWDTETSGQATSDGGTGKSTAEMQDIATFSGAGWNIIAVAPNQTNNAYIWNIVDGQTYPFLSWEL